MAGIPGCSKATSYTSVRTATPSNYRAHINLDTILISYFRLDEDMDAVYSILSSLDPYVATLAKAYPHLRLLHQPDPWECTVSYLCSANNKVERVSSDIVEGNSERSSERKPELSWRHPLHVPYSRGAYLNPVLSHLRALHLGLQTPRQDTSFRPPAASL